jgi:hypothetical protein
MSGKILKKCTPLFFELVALSEDEQMIMREIAVVDVFSSGWLSVF